MTPRDTIASLDSTAHCRNGDVSLTVRQWANAHWICFGVGVDDYIENINGQKSTNKQVETFRKHRLEEAIRLVQLWCLSLYSVCTWLPRDNHTADYLIIERAPLSV